MFELAAKNVSNIVNMQKGLNVIFVRHGECMANHSGTLVGYTDSPLTIKGKY